VDVTVVGPGGTSAISSADRFTYVTPPAPVVSGLSPTSGSGVGGDILVISGTGFTNASGVKFGTAAASFTFLSDTALQVTVPSGAAATVDVTVIGPGGTSALTTADRFTWTAPAAPTVAGLSPPSGLIAGGTKVKIVGTSFRGAKAVYFGSLSATSFSVDSTGTVITTTTPMEAAGTVDVTVLGPGGSSAFSPADRFTFVTQSVTYGPAPAVLGVGPATGSSAGGYTVTVIGTALNGATAVSFGTIPGTIQSVDPAGVFITVQAPREAVGVVDVRVTTSGGTSPITPADRFTFVTTPAPVVARLSQTLGSTVGGDVLAISGSGFTGATGVQFGSTPATFTVICDTAIKVTVPPGSAGTVDVTVIAPGGTSATSAADQFTYVTPAVPIVSTVTPGTPSSLGGALIAIAGTGFTAATSVSFGSTTVPPASVSPTVILVNAPTHALVTVYPIASSTVYRNTDGTGAETTSYAYTWFTYQARPQSMTVTRPTISAAQNGPGTPDTETPVYDVYGREIWTRDADGFITYTQYDPATGAVVKSIQDVDTSRTGDFQNLPSGWATPAGGGQHLVTLHEVDALGRDTAITDPNGNVTYTVYNDPDHSSRTYPGWNATTGMPTGPTQVTREDRGSSPSYVETFTMSAMPHVSNGRPDGTEQISGIQSLSRTFTNLNGQVVESDAYFTLNGVAYSTAPYLGTAGTNYYATVYGYDHHGRRDRVVSATGTITRTVHDGLGRVVSTWVGTNDTPASGWWSPDNNTAPANMVEVSANVYDNGGVGDGDLTQSTSFPGGGAAPRVTQYFYDWRDRAVATKQGVQASEADGTHRPIFYVQYDNLGEIVSREQYDGDGVLVTTTAGVPDRPAPSLLRAMTTSQYDDQGRLFRTHTYSVDPASGTVSTASLTTATWYDHRGNVIKSVAPGGLVTKNLYDGVGRVVTTYQTDGLGDATWADAGSVGTNNVLSQTDTQYDADGNPILVIQRDRFHDETTLGQLGDANSTDKAKARASYVASYYDAANRLTDRVDVGTNGGGAYTRPATVPVRSDTVLVAHADYNAAGWAQMVTDPRGLVTQVSYDLRHRVTQKVENFSGDGTPTDSTNRTTTYTYDGADHVLTETAVLPAGVTQTTQYVYGVTGVINSNDLLASVSYPANGQPNVETYTYDARGEMTSKTDRNGTTHSYSYDVLGRRTADAVTVLGAGVDGQVRRIETAYDSQGNDYLITSYDAPTGGNVVNQVLRQYNGLGQLTAEYQAHTGAVDTSSTPAVRYTWSEMAGGANHSRLVSMTYPNGRVVYDNYAAGVDDAISRVTSLSDNADGTGVLEAYSYLGLNTVVQRSRPQTGEELTYVKLAGESNGDAGDQYTGLDRFGRVVDQRWIDSMSGASIDEFRYGYDRDGNVL
jgi:YD repeat-containing protein